MSDLPAGWRLVKLGDVADCALGKMLDRGRLQGHAVVPYLRNANVKWGQIRLDDVASMELAPDEVERYSVMAGDLLVCEGGEIGRAAIWPAGSKNIAYQKALHRVRPRGKIDLQYVRYLLELYAQTGILLRHATGSTIKHLSQQQLRLLPVPLPPLAEQRRIVDVLENHLSRLDAAAGYLDASSRRLDTVLEAVLGSMDLGTLATLDSVLAQPMSNGRSVKTKDGGFPVLRLTALKSGAVDLFEIKEGDWTANEAAPFLVRRGDLLVSRGNGSLRLVARGALVPEPLEAVAYPDTMIRVRAHSERVDGRYLSLVWNSRVVRRQIESVARTTAGIYKVNQRHLQAVEVPVPSLGQQRAVVARADSVLSAGDFLASSLEAAGLRRAALRCALLTAAFSGRLTGRSTDTEVVEETAESRVAS